jgi:hypothetical protein
MAEQKDKNRSKDLWDKIAAITPIVLGLIVTGGAGVFGYLHNKRQDTLAEITALEQLQPKLNSESPTDRKFAYLAFAQMGYGRFALELIGLRNDNAAADVVSSIKNVDSNLTKQANATLKGLCPEGIRDIADCPDEGCGGGEFDPELNKRKTIRSDSQQPIMRSIRWIKTLPNPSGFFAQNTNRDELRRLGEGQKVALVAYALSVKKGGKESCNCGLIAPKDSDNHIVLVDPALSNPTLEADEKDSVTAEFTPRTRLDHVNFTQEKLESLIDRSWTPVETPRKGKLLVRVTGLLMFDSSHLLGHPLMRHSNWEIHPVLKMEYCPGGKACQADSDENWVDLDSQ